MQGPETFVWLRYIANIFFISRNGEGKLKKFKEELSTILQKKGSLGLNICLENDSVTTESPIKSAESYQSSVVVPQMQII